MPYQRKRDLVAQSQHRSDVALFQLFAWHGVFFYERGGAGRARKEPKMLDARLSH
jgi:hypothetical protein